MAKNTRFVNDCQWELLEPLLPQHKPNSKGGRPSRENREVLEGILWVLRSGARWQDLPDRYPSASTCWRRLQLWEEQGIWLDIWRKFLSSLDEKRRLDRDFLILIFRITAYALLTLTAAWLIFAFASVPVGITRCSSFC